MDNYRRNTFRHWCIDAGYLYLLVAALVVIAYLLGNLFTGLSIQFDHSVETLSRAEFR